MRVFSPGGGINKASVTPIKPSVNLGSLQFLLDFPTQVNKCELTTFQKFPSGCSRDFFNIM